MVSESINPLHSNRLRCCDRYIRCQRSLAVKPLTMSGFPSRRGSVRRVSRSQVTHVPISNCSYSMCAMTVSKLMSTCGNYNCASGGDGRCASNGAFSTGVPVDWGLSQRPARVDCGLSYTTCQATIALRAIVACSTDKSSAVAEMGDPLAAIDMGQKMGDVPLLGGSWVPIYLTQCRLGRGLPRKVSHELCMLAD